MFVNGKYHYICIVPQEWGIYVREDLELMIYRSLRYHFNRNGQIKNAVTTINNITAKTEYWNLKLWMKKMSDKSIYPDSNKYFWMLLDWRASPDKVSSDST